MIPAAHANFLVASTQASAALIGLLLGTYSIGLARAWQLLGAPRGRGTISGLWEWLTSRSRSPDAGASLREHRLDTNQKPDDDT